MRLVKASPEFGEALIDFNSEFEAYGERHFRTGILQSSLPAFFEQLARDEREPRDADSVPMTVYWLVDDDGRIYGEGRLRHYLNELLEKGGGHIGYHVRPSERRRGYGTLILKLMLDEARGRGLERVLLTCDTDNVHSARIIEKNGGVFEKHGISPWDGEQISFYWISL